MNIPITIRGFTRTFAIIFIICFASLYISCNSDTKSKSNNPVVSIAGDNTLHADEMFMQVPPEFVNFIETQQWLTIVDGWIDEELMVRYAIDNGIERNPEVKRRLEAARQKIIIDYLRDGIVAPKIEINKQDIENYYAANKGDFVRMEAEIHALYILVQDKPLAEKIEKLIASDDNNLFCNIAKQYSIEYSAHDSCDLGWFSKSDILPELVRPVFKTNPGDKIGPIKVENNYHFFYILDKKEQGTVRSIEQVENDISRKFHAARLGRIMSDLLDSLRMVSNISIDTAAIDSISRARNSEVD